MRRIQKPAAGEFPPYAIMYIGLLPDDELVLQHLENNWQAVKNEIYSLGEDKLNYRYAPGKWNIREILVHMMDDERIYAYRALRIARNDHTPLSGFEQDDYVLFSNAGARSLDSIFEEYQAVRQSTITLFNNLDDASFLRMGIANDHKVSVRALAYHIAGHELHHLDIIREKYIV